MIFPTFELEKKLWLRGCRFVAGLDEVGRGPLAGPVVAAAVCFDSEKIRHCEERVFERRSNPEEYSEEYSQTPSNKFSGNVTRLLRPAQRGTRNDLILRDSKKLSPRQRERWYEILTKDKTIKWGLGAVSQKIIDEINILEATKLAMKKALENLGIEPDFLLLDGNFLLEDLNISQKAVTRGDEKIFSVAAASIIAKVSRDRLMRKYHQKFPVYGFDEHKGYGTKKHFEALRLHGPCPLHRFSFEPVKSLLNKKNLN